MTGLGIAVAVVLLLGCALLFVPFRWRPVGLYLFMEKVEAAGYVPFIAAAGMALAAVGAVLGSWWITIPAGIAALGALVVLARAGAARVDLSGVLGAGSLLAPKCRWMWRGYNFGDGRRPAAWPATTTRLGNHHDHLAVTWPVSARGGEAH